MRQFECYFYIYFFACTKEMEIMIQQCQIINSESTQKALEKADSLSSLHNVLYSTQGF